jgi:hypothetical protein
MRICVGVAAIAAGLAACGKGDPPPPRPGSSGPASTVEIDALWALAPAGARGGIVASPRAVAMAERAVADVRVMLAKVPELAGWRRDLDELIATELGILSGSLVELGLTGEKGLALFLLRDGMVAILPLADRAAFLARARGSAGGGADGADGADGVDRIGTTACKPVRGAYACATAEALLDTLGKGDLAARLPPVGARGEVELVGIELPLGGAAPGELAAVIQLERGAAVIRGRVRGVAPALAGRFAAAHVPRADAHRAAGFALADLPALVGDAPSTPLLGTTLAEVARSLRGPLTIEVPAGRSTIDARQELADPAPLRALVEKCPVLTEPLGISATAAGGTCRLTMPAGRAGPEEPARRGPSEATGDTLQLDAWIEGGTLRIGDRSGGPAGATVPMTPMGVELARGPWAHAFWGRGALLGGTELAVPPPGAGAPPEALASLRALTLLSELGAGVRRDGDALTFVVAVRTVFANPDEVVAKLLAIPGGDLAAGRAGAAARPIAEAAPASPFAADLAAGEGGLVIPSMVLRAAVTLGVPALLRRRRPE